MMEKVLTFRVGIENLEDKIWRKIEIPDRRTVADLAYTILASFDSLAYHLYNIQYKNKVYDSWVCIEDDNSEVPPINATITKLSDLKLKEKDTLVMEYDYGSTTTFYLTFYGSKELDIFDNYKYPLIKDVRGIGLMLGAELVKENGQQASEETDIILEKMKDKGFIIGKNGIGRNVLAFQPTLVINEQNIKDMINALDEVLSELK